MENKLKEELHKHLYNVFIDNETRDERIYTLFSDVCVKFAEWNNAIDYQTAASLLEKKEFNYEDLFNYFIENIYNKECGANQ